MVGCWSLSHCFMAAIVSSSPFSCLRLGLSLSKWHFSFASWLLVRLCLSGMSRGTWRLEEGRETFSFVCFLFPSALPQQHSSPWQQLPVPAVKVVLVCRPSTLLEPASLSLPETQHQLPAPPPQRSESQLPGASSPDPFKLWAWVPFERHLLPRGLSPSSSGPFSKLLNVSNTNVFPLFPHP